MYIQFKKKIKTLKKFKNLGFRLSKNCFVNDELQIYLILQLLFETFAMSIDVTDTARNGNPKTYEIKTLSLLLHLIILLLQS